MKTLELKDGTIIKIRNSVAKELILTVKKYRDLDIIITLNKDKCKLKRIKLHINSIKLIS